MICWHCGRKTAVVKNIEITAAEIREREQFIIKAHRWVCPACHKEIIKDKER